MSTNGATRRINRGRNHSYEIDGERAPGITTALRMIAKPQFIDKAAETTARYAFDNWDELSALKPSERLDRMIRARYIALNEAGDRGKLVHAILHKLFEDAEAEVPDEARDYIDAADRFDAEWQPVPLLVERPVFSRRYGYAGTPDLIAELVDGLVWLLDWKTSASGIWPENTLQVAAARYADFYLDVDGNEKPLPPIDATGCIHLRADGYGLFPVPADEQAFAVFLAALELYKSGIGEKDARDTWVGDALLPPGGRT
jgi:hypothetical protein